VRRGRTPVRKGWAAGGGTPTISPVTQAAHVGINLAVCAGALLVTVVVLWRVAVRRDDVSIIDQFWGAGFVLVAVLTYVLPGGVPARQGLLTVLTGVWGLRLTGYLAWRNRGGEDRRYTAMRSRVAGDFHRWALTRVFLLQGLLIWVISLPVQVGGALSDRHAPAWPAVAGVVLWVVGFAFETVGDAQLARFRRHASPGDVLDSGLWRYTRHPNYFGDACLWWGIFLVACTHPAVLVTAFSPVLMTFLLLRVSGKPLLERDLTRRKQEYAAYVARTSGFLPLPPRRASAGRSPRVR
jgi:steroid 5-alpha reductase family enzyme